jgi:serine protease Do
VGEPQRDCSSGSLIQQKMKQSRVWRGLALGAGLVLLIFAGTWGFRAAWFKKLNVARETPVPNSQSEVQVAQGITVASGRASSAKGWLGIRIQDITPGIANDLHLGSTRGVLVADVDSGGPADMAGLQPQDVLLKFGGRAVSRSREVARAIAATRAGATVELTVLRGNKLLQIDAVAGKGSPDQVVGYRVWRDDPHGRLGITVENVTREAQRQMNLLSSKGALIIEVKPGEPADEGGVKAGDVILEFNHVPIESAASLQAVTRDLAKAGRVFLTVERQRQFLPLELDLP